MDHTYCTHKINSFFFKFKTNERSLGKIDIGQNSVWVYFTLLIFSRTHVGLQPTILKNVTDVSGSDKHLKLSGKLLRVLKG